MTLPTEAPLPVTVVGGYLGSGKTTLVNHLLRNAGGRRLAVLVNEFGALPIDEDLIEASGEDLISIAGGCVCCSYGGDLVAAFGRLRDRVPAPDHVLVEASGVALPHAIAATLSLIRGLVQESIVVLADAETLDARSRDRYVGDTVARQLASADLVLLNRCDLADEAALEGARETIADIAPQALVLDTEHSAVPPDVLLADGLTARRSKPPARVLERDSEGSGSDAVVHPRFASVELRPEKPVDIDALLTRLTAAGAGIVRAKGFLQDANGRMRAVQIAGTRSTVKVAPEGVAVGFIVIGLRPAFDPAAFDDLMPVRPRE